LETNCTNIFAFRSPKLNHLLQGNVEKFGEENVPSTPTSITSGWIESTESHVILDGGGAVCLLLSAHRAVIFAIVQLSCLNSMHCGRSQPRQTGSLYTTRTSLPWLQRITARLFQSY